jgi:hypothetical protein
MASQERLSPPLLEFPSVPTIDSSTLLGYLFQEFSNSNYFSSELDLSWLTPAIDYLYQQKVAVDLYSGKERQLREKYAPEEAKRRIAAERNIVFYYDPDTTKYQITPAVHGGPTSVHSQIIEVGRSGKEPLITLHSHPFEALPSPQDYNFLVLDSETSKRFIKAIMVICPQTQILALSTPQTPSLSTEEIIAFFNKFQTEVDSDPEITTLRQEEETIISDNLKQIGNIIGHFGETLAETIDKSGEIPPEKLKELEQTSYQRANLLGQELKDKLGPVHLDLINHSEKTLNAALLHVARLWNIQLYFSTDKSIFFKFSA